MSTQQDVTRVKEQHKETLLAKPNVIGVGVGYKVAGRTKTSEISVVALVRRKFPQAGLAPEAVVPSQVCRPLLRPAKINAPALPPR